MNARIVGMFGIAALVAGAALSCKSDPTADGAGTPSRVLVNFKSFTMDVGQADTIVAQVLDIRSTPLQQAITFTACDPSVTVAVDPGYNPHPPLSARAIITAVGPNATCVVASSSGATPDTTGLVVLPVTFGGAFSATSADAGQAMRIYYRSPFQYHLLAVYLI